MKDDYFGGYLLDEEQPKQLEKAIVKQELTPPAQQSQMPIAPPSAGPLPPGFQMPNIASSLNQTLQTSAINTGTVTAPEIDVNALGEKALKLKEVVGSANAPDLIKKENALPLLAGGAALASIIGAGLALSKKDERKTIADRDISKIEPDLTVNKQPIAGVTEPTYHEPQFSTLPTDADKLAAENIKMQSTELPGHIFNKYGVVPTNVKDLMIFANQATPEMKANFTPILIDMMNKGVIPKPAVDAGVTPSTSQPEAQTLVTTAEAAKDPAEKVKESIPPKELKTGSGMPAIQGSAPPGTPLRKELASAANIPSTHAFVPGGQYMDIVRNAVGQDAFTASLLKQGGYPQTPEEAYSLSRLINENMSRMPRDVAKDLNIGLGDTTKAITQKVGGGKAVKLAGTAGALILMSDLANAKTAKEKREAMRNLGEAILPPSMTSTEAGAPTLPANAFSESKKLGSPFRQQLMGVAPPAR